MEKFAQLLVGGLGLGGIYALVALGFVVVYKSSRAFNFAQGGFVLAGAFLTYQFSDGWGLPFAIGVGLAVVTVAALAAGIEIATIRPLLAAPRTTLLLVSLGVLIVVEQVVRTVWDEPGLVMSTPWGNDRYVIDGVTIRHVELWSLGSAAALTLVLYLFFARTRTGLGLRAAASDPEAAAAQGIRVDTAATISWAIAGAVAVVAGVMLTSRGGSALSPGVGFVAFRAFPAMIIGGLDSTRGAVLGGVIVGVAEVMTQGYVDLEALGAGFATIVPYLLMVVILLWRPRGLFGTPIVERL